MQGQITKGIAGFYFVKSGDTVYRCRARGLFKLQGMKPAVGDRVEFEIAAGEEDDSLMDISDLDDSELADAIVSEAETEGGEGEIPSVEELNAIAEEAVDEFTEAEIED